MCPGTALIEATDRRSELRPPRRGAQKEQLMERQLAGEDIALGKAGDLLDVERRNHLPVQDLRLESRCEALDRVDDRVAERLALRVGPATVEVVRRVLDEDRHDVLPS